METVDKIKLLISSSKEIKNVILELLPKWKSDPKNFDKVRVGFVSGETDGWCKKQEQIITFQAWVGTYGSSSVYQNFEPDGEIFKEAFIQYLNDNKTIIMLGIADIIDAKASKLKLQAQDELKKELEKIDQVS